MKAEFRVAGWCAELSINIDDESEEESAVVGEQASIRSKETHGNIVYESAREMSDVSSCKTKASKDYLNFIRHNISLG